MSRSSTRQILFYALPYLVVLGLTELVLYVLEDEQMCADVYTTYGYCPGFSEVRDLSRETQDYTEVAINIDANGAHIDPARPIRARDAELILIGDSFIQADEVPFDRTVYGRLVAIGQPAYALGYSSWNPLQFAGAVRKLNVRNGQYHVFLMTNDFTPSYDRSVAHELAELTDTKESGALTGAWRQLTTFSRLTKLIDHKWRAAFGADHAATAESEPQYRRLTAHHTEFSAQREFTAACQNVAGLHDGSLMADYLQFSKNAACWDPEFRTSVDQTVAAIRDLDAAVTALDGTLTLYLIPGGWAFPHQNTVGRLHPLYGVPLATTVSQAGLTGYLRQQGLEVIDLETGLYAALKAARAECGDCENLLYLPHDGHWTAYTHAWLARQIAR